ncbi:MAG: CBS domain-containing protein [Sphingomonadaceae bacterium]
MTIAAILHNKGSEVLSIGCGASLREAVELLADRRIGAMPVLKDGKVAGILSERDVIYCLRRDGEKALDLDVEQVMTAPPVTVTGENTVDEAMAQMTIRRIRHLPVVEKDELVGIVSIGDLVKYRIDRIEQEAAAMRDYIRTV